MQHTARLYCTQSPNGLIYPVSRTPKLQEDIKPRDKFRPQAWQEELVWYWGTSSPNDTRDAFIRLAPRADTDELWRNEFARVDWAAVYDSFQFDQHQLIDFSLPLHHQ